MVDVEPRAIEGAASAGCGDLSGARIAATKGPQPPRDRDHPDPGRGTGNAP